MRALITGGTGFLGQRLAKTLAAQGHDVTVTGRNPAIGRQLESEGIRFCQVELSDSARMIDACADREYVFHCGALSAPWGAYEEFYKSNVLGTQNVIAGCRKHGVRRLVHVSTPSIYFDYSDRFHINETALLPRKPANAYAQTKRLAEEAVDEAYQSGLAVITIRPRAIFGPGDQTILPRLLAANSQGRLPLIDGGQAWIDLTYVDNVVDALLLCLTAPASVLGQKFNITNGEPRRLVDLLQSLLGKLELPLRSKALSYRTAYAIASLMELSARIRRTSREPLLTRYTVGVLGKSQTLDISAATAQLGYTPRVSIEEGLEAFAHWWRETDDH